jgi:PHD/YefM family antitoxin component YafN of YafNO toxin-antitoxin module
MRHDRVAGVMVSAEDYEAMRVFYADRLRQTLRVSSEGAAVAGLTEEKLAQLLADES